MHSAMGFPNQSPTVSVGGYFPEPGESILCYLCGKPIVGMTAKQVMAASDPFANSCVIFKLGDILLHLHKECSNLEIVRPQSGPDIQEFLREMMSSMKDSLSQDEEDK